MPITGRRYYFKPDARSLEILPTLFRVNQEDINDLIAVDQEVQRKLDEMRRQDPETSEAQSELDTLKRLCDEHFEKIRQPGDALLKGMRERNYSMQKLDGAKERFLALKLAREQVSKERRALMGAFHESIQYEARYEAASQVVAKANKRDQPKLLKVDLKACKHAVTHQYNKYHIDDFTQRGLPQARITTLTGKVEFRKFTRGYGTQLPTQDTLATGHNQTESKRRRTVKELREGAQNRVLKRLEFPQQSAWDLSRPKYLRRAEQRGRVALMVMGNLIEGSCLFHQSVPDDYCVTDVKLGVEVRGGNTHFYLILTMMDRASSAEKQKAGSFDTLLEILHQDPTPEAAKPLGKLKGQIVKKIAGLESNPKPPKNGERTLEEYQDLLATVQAALDEIQAIKAAAKEAEKAAKKLAKATKNEGK